MAASIVSTTEKKLFSIVKNMLSMLLTILSPSSSDVEDREEGVEVGGMDEVVGIVKGDWGLFCFVVEGLRSEACQADG